MLESVSVSDSVSDSVSQSFSPLRTFSWPLGQAEPPRQRIRYQSQSARYLLKLQYTICSNIIHYYIKMADFDKIFFEYS
jgi:hypothetical protein